MKRIELTQGKYALVDDEDFEFLNQWKWFLHSKGYAVRSVWLKGKISPIFLHRLINKTPKGMCTDHINRNRLDDRKNNLRSCTPTENNLNRGLFRRRGGSFGFKGVRWCKKSKAWQTRITCNHQQVFIGEFKNKRHAALAYDIWARDLYGEGTVLNF